MGIYMYMYHFTELTFMCIEISKKYIMRYCKLSAKNYEHTQPASTRTTVDHLVQYITSTWLYLTVGVPIHVYVRMHMYTHVYTMYLIPLSSRWITVEK